MSYLVFGDIHSRLDLVLLLIQKAKEERLQLLSVGDIFHGPNGLGLDCFDALVKSGCEFILGNHEWIIVKYRDCIKAGFKPEEAIKMADFGCRFLSNDNEKLQRILKETQEEIIEIGEERLNLISSFPFSRHFGDISVYHAKPGVGEAALDNADAFWQKAAQGELSLNGTVVVGHEADYTLQMGMVFPQKSGQVIGLDLKAKRGGDVGYIIIKNNKIVKIDKINGKEEKMEKLIMKAVTKVDLGDISNASVDACGVTRKVYFGNYRVVKEARSSNGDLANQIESYIWEQASDGLKEFLPSTTLTPEGLIIQDRVETDPKGLIQALQNTFPDYVKELRKSPRFNLVARPEREWSLLWEPIRISLSLMKAQLASGKKDNTELRQAICMACDVYDRDFGPEMYWLKTTGIQAIPLKALLELPLETLWDLHSQNVGYCPRTNKIKILDFAGSPRAHKFIEEVINKFWPNI